MSEPSLLLLFMKNRKTWLHFHFLNHGCISLNFPQQSNQLCFYHCSMLFSFFEKELKERVSSKKNKCRMLQESKKNKPGPFYRNFKRHPTSPLPPFLKIRLSFFKFESYLVILVVLILGRHLWELILFIIFCVNSYEMWKPGCSCDKLSRLITAAYWWKRRVNKLDISCKH